MAKKVKVKLNRAGFRELRRSPGPTALTRQLAEQVALRAGPGYQVSEGPSRNRARFTVHPETNEAISDNARNNTLVRVLK